MTDQLASEKKPLDAKTNAELKREAKARLMRVDPPAEVSKLAEEVIGKRVGGSVSGFVSFLRERAVVGLAVGFAIGAQAQVVVKQFITSFVDPLFKLLIPGDQVLSTRASSLSLAGHTASFAWGALVYSLLDFLFILFTIYVVVRVFKLEQLDKKDEKK